MLGYTLKEYKENYFINLNAYLDEYEDNSKSEFLEKELSKIQLYSTALDRISRAIIAYNRPKNATIRSGKELLLKQQHFKVYDDIVSNIDLVEGDNFGQQLEPGLISIDCVKLENYIKSASLILKFISDEFKHDNSSALTNTNSSNSFDKSKFDQRIPEDKFTSTIWFKVGLLFAKGELNQYSNSNKSGFKKGYSALKVAKELGNKSYEKYILATINNYPSDNVNGDKNIYNSKDKMDKIIVHCNENQVIVDDYFKSKLPLE